MIEKRVRSRYRFILITVLALLVLVAYGHYISYMDPYRGTTKNPKETLAITEKISSKLAKKDLDYLYDKLSSRHPLWLQKDNALIQQVKDRYLTIKKEMPDEISVLELFRDCSELVAMLHDGHTYIFYNNEYRAINDINTAGRHAPPLRINGVPYQTVLESFKKYSSYEYDFYIDKNFQSNYMYYDIYMMLTGYGRADGVTMTFEQQGKEKDFSFHYQNQRSRVTQPRTHWVHYNLIPSDHVAIFTLKQCKYNEEYKTTVKDFFRKVDENDIQNVIVDLRGNGGGNSMVATEFLSYLDIDSYNSWGCDRRYGNLLIKNKGALEKNKKKEPQFGGLVYVLTDNQTYSSAMDFAMLFKDNQLGTIVGEPSGNSPDGFGDCLVFSLPNSKLGLTVSWKKWYRIDRSKAGEPIMPDYEVPSKQALSKALQLVKDKSDE